MKGIFVQWCILVLFSFLCISSSRSVNNLSDIDLEAEAAEPRPVFVELVKHPTIVSPLPLVYEIGGQSDSPVIGDASEKVERKILSRPLAFSYNQQRYEELDNEGAYDDQSPDYTIVTHYKHGGHKKHNNYPVEEKRKRKGDKSGRRIIRVDDETNREDHDDIYAGYKEEHTDNDDGQFRKSKEEQRPSKNENRRSNEDEHRRSAEKRNSKKRGGKGGRGGNSGQDGEDGESSGEDDKAKPIKDQDSEDTDHSETKHGGHGGHGGGQGGKGGGGHGGHGGSGGGGGGGGGGGHGGHDGHGGGGKKQANGKFEKGGGKEHHADHKSSHGEKGDKGYEGHHKYEKGEKGHHTKEGHKGSYKDEGGEKKHHHEEAGHFGEHKHGEKGEKGSKYSEEGKHSKGHSTKGEHNIHKKDEYEKKQEFYDESHEGGEHEKHGGFHHADGYHKGGHEKGGHKKGGHHTDHYGKESHEEKGGHHHEDKGHKKAAGHDSHHSHGSKYGKKGKKEGGKKWAYKKGSGGGGGGHKHKAGGGGGGGGGHKHGGGGHGSHSHIHAVKETPIRREDTNQKNEETKSQEIIDQVNTSDNQNIKVHTLDDTDAPFSVSSNLKREPRQYQVEEHGTEDAPAEYSEERRPRKKKLRKRKKVKAPKLNDEEIYESVHQPREIYHNTEEAAKSIAEHIGFNFDNKPHSSSKIENDSEEEKESNTEESDKDETEKKNQSYDEDEESESKSKSQEYNENESEEEDDEDKKFEKYYLSDYNFGGHPHTEKLYRYFHDKEDDDDGERKNKNNKLVNKEEENEHDDYYEAENDEAEGSETHAQHDPHKYNIDLLIDDSIYQDKKTVAEERADHNVAEDATDGNVAEERADHTVAEERTDYHVLPIDKIPLQDEYVANEKAKEQLLVEGPDSDEVTIENLSLNNINKNYTNDSNSENTNYNENNQNISNVNTKTIPKLKFTDAINLGDVLITEQSHNNSNTSIDNNERITNKPIRRKQRRPRLSKFGKLENGNHNYSKPISSEDVRYDDEKKNN